MRWDQIQPSASGSSGARRTYGTWKTLSSDEGRAWKGDWKSLWDGWIWARSEEEKAIGWDTEYDGESLDTDGRERKSRRLPREKWRWISRKNLSLKLKELRSTRSLAGNIIWRQIQGYSQRQPLRLSGNCGSTGLLKVQRGNLQNKEIRGSLRHSHQEPEESKHRPVCPPGVHQQRLCLLRWPQNQRRHALF